MNAKWVGRIALGVLVLVVLAGGIMVTVVLPPQLTAATGEPATDTPEKVGLAYEEVAFPTHGASLTIRGWWIPYQGDGEIQGTAIFVHGANGNRADEWAEGLGLIKMLEEYGHNVLTIDLRNHGTSDDTADNRLMLGRDEANDVIAAIDYALTREPDLPIVAMGLSMGGATVIHAAARDPRIRGLVLLDPLLDPFDAMANGAWASTGFPHAVTSAVAWSAGTFHGTPVYEDKPSDVLRTLTIPVLIVQDEGDPVCRAEYARKSAEENPAVDLLVVAEPPADHPRLAMAGRWGAHVGAYIFHPEEARAVTEAFLSLVHTLCRTPATQSAAVTR